MHSFKMSLHGVKMFLFLSFVWLSEARKLTWKYSAEAMDTTNWVGGKYSQNCKGIYFAEENSAPIWINDVSVSQLVLPRDGELVLNGAVKFTNDKKCIKLKPINYHEWYDPDGWFLDGEPNAALPDKLKVPCHFDTKLFPKSSVETSTLRRWAYSFLTRDYGMPCRNINICKCHPYFDMPCLPKANEKKVKCKDPIIPQDFCHEICGAYMTFKGSSKLKIEAVLKKLKTYPVDTFVAPVNLRMEDNLMQVVFSEKDFSGQSLGYADDFFKYLSSFKLIDLKLVKSGEYNAEGGSTVSIILGTLFAVVLFFGILFYLHERPSFSNLLTRFNTRKGSMFNMPFFARFDNTDENLIMEGQSEAGSILDISKSFDNPMFGQEAAATVSSEHENPLYEATKED